jgi:O-succinylbenzoic acid--CoA ligase
MKDSSSTLNILKLDFDVYSSQELLDRYDHVDLPVWAQDVLDFLKEFVTENQITCLTSGTTGPPKKVFIKKYQLIGSAKNTLSFFDLQEGSKALLPLSCKHIAGKMMVVRAAVGKMSLTVIKPTTAVDSVINDEFDFSAVVPLQLQSLLSKNDNLTLRCMGKILVGGSSISEKLVKDLNELGLEAWCSFGMTETVSHFAIRQLSPKQDKGYVCLEGFIIDEQRGLLSVSNSDLGIRKIQTNDVVDIFHDGSFTWLGRADNVVNSGGVKLHPEVLEQKIRQFYPAVPSFILFGISDDRLGEKLVMFYEEGSALSAEQKKLIAVHLDKYEQPQEYVKIKKLNRTPSGKIIRKNYLFQ